MTPRMLSVLAYINGSRSLAEIGKILKISYGFLYGDIHHLHALNLIIDKEESDDNVRFEPIKSDRYSKTTQQVMLSS